MSELHAVLAIAYRDLLKFLRDPTRMAVTFVFPVILIGALGGTLQSSFGRVADFSLITFTFTGVFAQTLFQSTAFGLISLIEDRENDFTQEVFVAPISRYSIVAGKVIGETLVALPQAVVVVAFALVLGIPLSAWQALSLVPTGLAAALLGGGFGLIVLANLSTQRAANQVFPFVMLPQYFLAGVFSPMRDLPPYLDLLSRISPLRYAVDLTRGTFYAGQPDARQVVVDPPALDLVVVVVLFAVFLIIGTTVFVRRESNR